MSEEARVCAKCGSAGPFVLISDGRRCQQCGDVQPVAVGVRARYQQPDVPPKPLSGKASWKNPLGA